MAAPDLRRAALPAVLMLAVLARLALIAPTLGRPPWDPDNYLPLAGSVAEGRGLAQVGRPTAYRPPLYPIVLAPIVGLLGEARAWWGVAALHLALGAGTAGLVHRAARRWGLSPGRALAASAVVALDPVLVAQARAVMTETLAAFLLAAALAALAGARRLSPAAGGLALGLAALCRPSLLPVAGLASLAALNFGPGRLGERFARAGLLAGATALVLAPWAVRNALVLGSPILTTTHGGYTLALANNEVYYREVLDGPPGAVWEGEEQARWFERVNRELAGLPEPEADRRLRDETVRFIADRPGDFARAALARLGRLWGPAPSPAVYPAGFRVASALWAVPLWAALGLGLVRRETWRWPRVAAPAAALALSLVHLAFWTDQRMRAPIVPAVALIAASAGRFSPTKWRETEKSEKRLIGRAEPESTC